MKNVVIIGASGHGKVIADIVVKSGDNVVGFLDDNENLPERIVGFKHLGKISDIDKLKNDNCFIIGIGDNKIRRSIAKAYDVEWYTAIHPTANIAIETQISEGTVICANAVINVSAKIGKHCIINTSSIIEHDNMIGDYAQIAPNATICGTVEIGSMTTIGAGAVVRNNLKICDDCLIGIGAVVVKSINESGVYVGVPARLMK